jgi:hypothetical protein
VQAQGVKAIDTLVEGEGGGAPVSGPEGLGPSIEADK